MELGRDARGGDEDKETKRWRQKMKNRRRKKERGRKRRGEGKGERKEKERGRKRREEGKGERKKDDGAGCYRVGCLRPIVRPAVELHPAVHALLGEAHLDGIHVLRIHAQLVVDALH